MSVKYDLYQNPPSAKNAGEYHVRVKSSGTFTTERLAKEIEHATSLTAADVRSVLTAMSQLLGDKLSNGWNVQIEGLGYFSLTASAPSVPDPNKMRAEHVSVRGIDYRAEKELLDHVRKRTEFERAPFKRHSVRWSMDELKAWLDNYFLDHAFITRGEFELQCGFTRSTAIDRLNRLVEEGFLCKQGLKRYPVYAKKADSDQ